MVIVPKEPTEAMPALGVAESALLKRVARGENILGSDRLEDRAKTRLKKLGLIQFNRPTWHWSLTDKGRAMIASHRGDNK